MNFHIVLKDCSSPKFGGQTFKFLYRVYKKAFETRTKTMCALMLLERLQDRSKGGLEGP